jgi:hypothetical protein
MKLLFALFVALICGGCGGTDTHTPASSSQSGQLATPVSSDPHVQFFHDQLIANGDDVQGEFGTYLSMLGMNPRDLQQDDPRHAYDTVLEKVKTVDDASLRGAMMQTLFNLADQ